MASAGLEFDVEPSDVDESLEGRFEPEAAALILARRKAEAVALLHLGEDVWVLGSDTVVALGEGSSLELLGKPEDALDARRMLEALSDSRHRVVTGVCVVRCLDWDPKEPEKGLFDGFERTWVSMREISEAEIAAYVDSEEWCGKAGGYAIQENADAFVTRLEEGSFDNVVGLPVSLTLELLRNSGSFTG
ncbi:MAG: septum formation protein [Planctomycetota bacterium]